jgi:diaminopimelate epimerase
LVVTRTASPEIVSVAFGPPHLRWHEIPLLSARSVIALGLEHETEAFLALLPTQLLPEFELHRLLAGAVAVSMGNPHLVLFSPSTVTDALLAALGGLLERHSLFPARTNVEFVAVEAPDRLRVRVWERGTGITQACGTGACAALVAARLRGHAAPAADVLLDGGVLRVAWEGEAAEGPLPGVFMTGRASRVCSGQISEEFLHEPAVTRAA